MSKERRAQGDNRSKIGSKHGSVWYTVLIEGSLEVKLPTIWTDGKAEVGRVREEKKKRQKKGDQTREKIQASEKLEKSRITMFFPHP
jgi:hypothetical protein